MKVKTDKATKEKGSRKLTKDRAVAQEGRVLHEGKGVAEFPPSSVCPTLKITS